MLVVALTAACEGAPARPKPWRHDVDQAPAAAPATQPAAVPVAVEAAAREKRLRIRLEAEPRHLNPLVDPDRSTLRVVEGTIFETLLHYRPPVTEGSAGTLEAGLAHSFRVSPDGRELRFQLREGVTFHDGKPFTSVDAQFSIDAARSRAGRAPARLQTLLADVQTVDLVGPRELRVTLRRPNGYALRAMAEVPILPAHLYRDELRRPGRTAIGTGPYRLAEWKKGEAIRLLRNETYAGDKAAIAEVELVIEPDGAKALIEAKRGAIDVVPELIAEHVPEQLAAPGVKGTFAEIRLRPAAFTFMVVNARRPPFDDARVRRAAALLVDRKKIADEILGGLARPVAGPVWPGGPVDGPAPPAPAFDPAAAARLLDEAGWKDADGDGMRERNGERLRVSLLATTDARGDAERDLVVAALRKGGFLVDVRPGESAFLLTVLRGGEFGAALVELRGRADDDVTGLFESGGKSNWGGFASPAVDRVCARLRAAYEPAARREAAGELGRLLAEEMPVVPLTAPEPVGLAHRRVEHLAVWDGWFAIAELALR